MAEVRSYKCDICGEVYHEGKDDGEYMRITYHREIDNGEYGTVNLNHICPECRVTIAKVIGSPKILDTLRERIEYEAEKKRDFRDLLLKLKRTFTMEDPTIKFLLDDFSKPESFKKIVDDFIESWSSYKKSSLIWKRVAFAAIGLVVGVIGGLILRAVM